MMELIFIYGPPAAGKLTVAKQVAAQTGFKLFHNHLVVDAVHAVFEFGSDAFVRLRDQFWMDVFAAAADEGRSLVFTFQPEASVAPDFPARVRKAVMRAGGTVRFVYLTASLEAQRQRIANQDRAAFGKMRDADLLAQLHQQFVEAEAAMPKPDLVINTDRVSPDEAADMIVGMVQ